MKLVKNLEGVGLKGKISACFTDYFQNLFSSDGYRDWSGALNCILPSVTMEMNEELLMPVTLELA